MKLGSNIRLREDGRYEARYFKGKTANGNPLYGSVYGSSAEEADEKRTELLKSLKGSGSQARLLAEREPSSTRVRNVEPLDENQTRQIEAIFKSDSDGALFGFSLCLHMGISHAELCALKYSDFNFDKNRLVINRRMSSQNKTKGEIRSCAERNLPIPLAVRNDYYRAERDADCYVLTDSEVPIESTLSATYLLKRVLGSGAENKNITSDSLQMTFVRRAFESGISGGTLEAITGISAKTLDRRFKQYKSADPLAIIFISEKYNPSEIRNNYMNLLILGAGSHGHAIYEMAERLGVFQKIKFLDDKITGPEIIGRCADITRFASLFNCCFIAIGDNHVRKKYGEQAISLGYILPRIISPEASIANKNVEIGIGTVIFPQATVNLGSKIGAFNIVASNSMIGFDSSTGDYVNCDSGSIVMRGSSVPDLTTVESGEIVKS